MSMRCLIALLHLLQPVARLYGRLCCGLTLWRHDGSSIPAFPWPGIFGIWTEHWHAPSERLQSVESKLRAEGVCVFRGGDFDSWDLETRPNMLGTARLRMAVEEHGLGRQLVRFRVWPKPSAVTLVLVSLFCALASWAALDRAWAGATFLAVIAVILPSRLLQECPAATSSFLSPSLAQHPPPTQTPR